MRFLSLSEREIVRDLESEIPLNPPLKKGEINEEGFFGAQLALDVLNLVAQLP